MKLTKRIFALALALCLILCLSISAFAADAETTTEGTTVPEYTDNGTVIIHKTYRLIGEGTSPAETFKLEQISVEQLDGDTMLKIPNLEGQLEGEEPNQKLIVGSASFAEGKAVANPTEKDAVNIEITLPAASSYNVGIYKYTLKEVAGNTAGVTYYDKPIALILTVVEEGGHKRIAAVHTEDAKTDGSYEYTDSDDEGKKDTFENTYSAGKLTFSKKVEGNLGDKSKYFKFTLKFTKAQSVEGKNFIPFTSTQASYDVNNDGTKDNPNTVDFETAGYTFWLKDDETITVSNIPEGVTYTIEEADYTTTEKYTTTNTIDNVESTDNGKKATAEIKTEAGKNVVKFTNTKNGDVDTGVYMDSLPYILALAVALGGAVVLFTRKRHIEE